MHAVYKPHDELLDMFIAKWRKNEIGKWRRKKERGGEKEQEWVSPMVKHE